MRPLIHVFPHDTKFDFVSMRFWGFGFTALLLLITVISLWTQGFNLGIDFKGGIMIEAKAHAAQVNVSALRSQLNGLGLGDVEIQQSSGPDSILTSSSSDSVIIRIQQQTGGEKAQMDAIAKVRGILGSAYEERRVDVVGPRVGHELFRAGILAMGLAMIAISLYVAFRFEWQFGVAALIATFHDVLVTMGLYSILQLDFNLTAVAALLTLAGYSLNDTVVVFDRIREILKRHRRVDMRTVINDATNQMLSRTMMTAGTTLMALIPLLLFGGQTLLNFSLAMTWGVLIGTFSSVYVAGSLLIYIKPPQ